MGRRSENIAVQVERKRDSVHLWTDFAVNNLESLGFIQKDCISLLAESEQVISLVKLHLNFNSLDIRIDHLRQAHEPSCIEQAAGKRIDTERRHVELDFVAEIYANCEHLGRFSQLILNNLYLQIDR